MTQQFNNPIPVVVCMVPLIDELTNEISLLGVVRGIEPQIGGVAMPGGYVDEGESAEQAATRELDEETGIYIAEDDWITLGTSVTPSNRLLILLVSEYPVARDLINSFTANDEVSALVAIDEDTSLCFPIHDKWVKEFFAQAESCGCNDSNCHA